MRSNKAFYFFIVDGGGRSAYWEDEMVKWSSLPKPLEFSPDGWKDIQPSFDRSNKYFGINRTITNPFKFVEDGASILRYFLYKKQSYESKLYLCINKWNDETDVYDAYYSAEIDFIKDGDDVATGIRVNLIEGNFLKDLNANDNTTFEIPCEGVQIQLDGLALDNTANYVNVNIEVSGADVQHHLTPVSFINADGTQEGIVYSTQELTDFDNGGFFYSDHDQEIHLETTIKARLYGVDDWISAIVYLLAFKDGVSRIVATQNFADPDANTILEFPFDETITVLAGEILRFESLFTGDVSPSHLDELRCEYTETPLTITYVFQKEPALCVGIRPYDLYQALLAKVGADSRYAAISTLLDDYKHLVVSCITAVRQLEDPVIKTSFADFFKAFNAILFAGFGVSGLNLIFERRQYFYNPDTVTLELGETSELNISVAEDQLCNTGKFGYPAQDIEALNGRYSFNNTSEFKFPLNKVKKDYEAISPYLTDCYLIESKRINLAGKTTTDDRSDNSTVIFNTIDAQAGIEGVTVNYSPGVYKLIGQAENISKFVEDSLFIMDSTYPEFTGAFTVVSTAVDGADLLITILERPDSIAALFTSDITFPLTLRRVDYDSLTGVPTDTVYNIEDLTPKRIMQKHYPFLRSLMYWMALEKIEFTTADKNKDLVTVEGTTTIAESANVRADQLGSPLFYPFIFTFKTRVPKTFTSLMYDAVNGHVQFNYNGYTFYGFPIHLTVKPDLNESQEWKLLASPANNLDLLVNLIANPTNNLFMSTYGMSFSRLCPVQFVPQGLELLPPYNFRHMDSWTNEEQKDSYVGYQNYAQPWQTSDIIRLQCITRDLGPVQVQLVNKYNRVFGTFPLQNITTAAVKAPYILYEGDVELTSVEPGCYRLKAVAGVDDVKVTFLSEWLNIQVTHPKTLLFEYSHNKNMASTIFTTGYDPSYRVGGNIVDFVPKSRFAAYEDQVADIALLDSVRFRQFTLLIGNNFGVPDWAIDKINAIMNCNNVDIDGKGFTRNEDAQFEVLNPPPGVTSKYWTLEIREAVNRDNVSLSTDGELNQSAVLINVDTTLFGDLSSQVSSNPIQVEVLNNNN